MGNKLIFTDNYIEIQCSRNDYDTHLLANKIPYIHSNRTKTVFRTSVRNIDLVLKVFRGIDESSVDKLPEKVRKRYDAEMLRRAQTKTLIDLGPEIPEGDWLMPHQRLGVELAKVNKRWGFFYDTRTGKTPMSIEIMQQIPIKWLVVCPLILIKEAWLDDFEKFATERKVVNLHASTKAKRLKQFQEKANIYIQNTESFVSWADEIRKLGIQGIILDESSSLKSYSSKFSKEMLKMAHEVEYFYLLSGTPAPNGEYEYYTQLRCLDNYSLPQSYSQFERVFFDNVAYNPQFKDLRIKQFKEDELKELISTYAIYIDKEDAFETAGRDFENYRVEMPSDVKEHYVTMARELYCDIEEGVDVVALSSAAKVNKLRQISSGFVYDDEQKAHMISDFKLKALQELLDTYVKDEQAIIWANFKTEIASIQQMLGDKCGIVNGTVTLSQKQQAISDFKSGKIQYLVANPASADKGLTLTNAHICVYYSPVQSYELYKQSMERIYGRIQSQPKRCKYYHMIVEGSVDTDIQRAVKDKQNVSEAILNYIRFC